MAVHELRAPQTNKPLWWRLLTRRDVLAGLLFMTVALVGLWVSRDYPIGTALRMSTGYVPRLLLWALLLLGGAILVSGIRVADAGSDLEPGRAWRPIILVPAALVAFALGLDGFGLVVACALLVGIGSLANRDLRLVDVIGAGLLLTFMTWAIFVWALGLTIRVWPEW
jgi:putative tricarboxylic transport membrane protein